MEITSKRFSCAVFDLHTDLFYRKSSPQQHELATSSSLNRIFFEMHSLDVDLNFLHFPKIPCKIFLHPKNKTEY